MKKIINFPILKKPKNQSFGFLHIWNINKFSIYIFKFNFKKKTQNINDTKPF
jgi:hypothetical protein